MILFSLMDIIKVPFGYLLDFLYRLTNSYGLAIILFAVAVKLIMLPVTAKSKRSSMKMSRMTPRIREIQEKYANDQVKQNEAMQKLYQEEGVSMFGGCLWSLVPILIIFPLYAVVRQPITYMLHESTEVATQIISIIKNAAPELFGRNSYYDQMVAAANISKFAPQIQAAIPEISAKTLEGLNFNFLGIDLGSVAQFNVFNWSAWDWAHIGAFLIPCLSALSQIVSMKLNQKLNNSLVTDKNGVQDKETADNSQTNQSMKTMMIISPLMSLWIGFTIPLVLSLYWLAQGIVNMILDSVLTLHYRKVYDAEDAQRLRRAMEEDAAEAERERVRAERRAANPDGITENTSRKKLQQKQRAEQQAARAAAAREYAARRGEVTDDESGAPSALSGIAERPYCKGRAYDPNRYTTEE